MIYDCDSIALLDNFPFLIIVVIKANHLRTESVIWLRFWWSCIDLSLDLRVLLLSKLYFVCVYVCEQVFHISSMFLSNIFFRLEQNLTRPSC